LAATIAGMGGRARERSVAGTASLAWHLSGHHASLLAILRKNYDFFLFVALPEPFGTSSSHFSSLGASKIANDDNSIRRRDDVALC
jgi:hypothetical protein